jgi:hypothetical protein
MRRAILSDHSELKSEIDLKSVPFGLSIPALIRPRGSQLNWTVRAWEVGVMLGVLVLCIQVIAIYVVGYYDDRFFFASFFRFFAAFDLGFGL